MPKTPDNSAVALTQANAARRMRKDFDFMVVSSLNCTSARFLGVFLTDKKPRQQARFVVASSSSLRRTNPSLRLHCQGNGASRIVSHLL
jgi:hypothetical protein